MPRPYMFRLYDASSLTEHETKLLWEDIAELAREMDCDADSDLGLMAAEREHYHNVGGQKNLRSYVDCLLAGERADARRK